jgi:beta-phosphoglucomutase
MDVPHGPAAIIWDLDGVLILSAEWHYAAWRRALAEVGVDLTPNQFRETFGRRNEEILAHVLGDGAKRALAEGIPDRKERYYRRLMLEHVEPAPGAAAWLRYASDHGVRQAVASSAPRENIEAVLDRLGLRPHFQAIRAAEDVTRGKPAPDIFQAAGAALGCEAARSLVVEDAPAGVAAAKAAGMRCLAVATSHPRETLAGAGLVAASLADADPEETLGRLFERE